MIREKGVAQEINGDRKECVSDEKNMINLGHLEFCFLRFLIRKEATCLYVYFMSIFIIHIYVIFTFNFFYIISIM